MVLEVRVQCIVSPAPAEKPIIPIRFVSTPHSLARLTIMAYAGSASSSWLDRSQAGRGGGAVSFESFEDSAGGAGGRFIEVVKSSSDSGVGKSLYLSTKAAIPCFANASATSQPSLPKESHLKPPPGVTMTAVPFALPGSGKKGVRVAVVMLRAIGSPHWRNQVSDA